MPPPPIFHAAYGDRSVDLANSIFYHTWIVGRPLILSNIPSSAHVQCSASNRSCHHVIPTRQVEAKARVRDSTPSSPLRSHSTSSFASQSEFYAASGDRPVDLANSIFIGMGERAPRSSGKNVNPHGAISLSPRHNPIPYRRPEVRSGGWRRAETRGAVGSLDLRLSLQTGHTPVIFSCMRRVRSSTFSMLAGSVGDRRTLPLPPESICTSKSQHASRSCTKGGTRTSQARMYRCIHSGLAQRLLKTYTLQVMEKTTVDTEGKVARMRAVPALLRVNGCSGPHRPEQHNDPDDVKGSHLPRCALPSASAPNCRSVSACEIQTWTTPNSSPSMDPLVPSPTHPTGISYDSPVDVYAKLGMAYCLDYLEYAKDPLSEGRAPCPTLLSVAGLVAAGTPCLGDLVI